MFTTSKRRNLMTQLRTVVASFLILSLSLMLTACAAVGGAVTGKPNTSPPSTAGGYMEFWENCKAQKQEMDDWLEREEKKIENEWIDNKRDALRSWAAIERAKEQAEAMKDELTENCRIKDEEVFGPATNFPTPMPMPTPKGGCKPEHFNVIPQC